MEDKKEDFSKTTMWKKSLAADEKRHEGWAGKTQLIIGTVAAVLVVLGTIYFLSR